MAEPSTTTVRPSWRTEVVGDGLAVDAGLVCTTAAPAVAVAGGAVAVGGRSNVVARLAGRELATLDAADTKADSASVDEEGAAEVVAPSGAGHPVMLVESESAAAATAAAAVATALGDSGEVSATDGPWCSEDVLRWRDERGGDVGGV